MMCQEAFEFFDFATSRYLRVAWRPREAAWHVRVSEPLALKIFFVSIFFGHQKTPQNYTLLLNSLHVACPYFLMKIFALRRSIRMFLFLLFFHLSGLVFWGASFLYFVDEIYGPSLFLPFEAKKENFPLCKPSTHELNDLILNEDSEGVDFQRFLSEHGMAIIPSILTRQTSERFRQFVLNANSA